MSIRTFLAPAQDNVRKTLLTEVIQPRRNRVCIETFVPDHDGEPDIEHVWTLFEVADPSPLTGETTTLFVSTGVDGGLARHGSIRV